MKIVVSYDPPPIPVRTFDWCAVDDDSYEEGQPVGYGRTEEEAVADLLTLLDLAVEDILSLTDQEVLDEVRKDGDDPAVIADHMRAIVKAAIQEG